MGSEVARNPASLPSLLQCASLEALSWAQGSFPHTPNCQLLSRPIEGAMSQTLTFAL